MDILYRQRRRGDTETRCYEDGSRGGNGTGSPQKLNEAKDKVFPRVCRESTALPTA